MFQAATRALEWCLNYQYRARATSAAPTWFEQCLHTSSQRTYLDGGLHNNNPVNITISEQCLIWGAECPIGINVSLGCGAPEIDLVDDATDDPKGYFQNLKEKLPGRGSWLMGRYIVDLVKVTLDTQKTWD